MRKQVIRLLSGGPFESAARQTYNTAYSRIPAAMLPAEAVKSRNYDKLTTEIARAALSGGGNSIDVGAHCGGILKTLTKLSPAGSHWAFEPIPNLAKQLRKRFPGVSVGQLALSDFTGRTQFHFLPGAAAYSSLLTRPEVEAGQVVRIIEVDVRRLDDCIPRDVPIAFIKIDVEGAEAAVLRGAGELLERDKPVVVFECAPEMLANCLPILNRAGLHVSFLVDYLAGERVSANDLLRIGGERNEYYYVAAPG